MNIEQIAQEVANELFLGGKAVGHEPVEFLRRCLSKLAEQDVEPVGYVDEHGMLWRETTTHTDTRLYTETQLLAAQQNAAHKAGEVMRERCESMLRYQGGANIDLVRALPGVTLEDLK